MIYLKTDAMLGINPVLNVMIAHGLMPEEIVVYNETNEQAILTPEPTYDYLRPFDQEGWKTAFYFAWANGHTKEVARLEEEAYRAKTRDAFDAAKQARLRWKGQTIGFALPADWQAEVDAEVDRIHRKWQEKLAEAFISTQRKRIHVGGYTVERIVEEYPSLAGYEDVLLAPWVEKEVEWED